MAVVERKHHPEPAASPSIGALRAAGARSVLVGGALPFDVLESKVRVPEVRPTAISRTALINRLRAAGAHPLALVVAPAGYGKTTLLAQWAGRDGRPFAWVSVDERDDDPFVLLRHVGAALDRIEPLDGGVGEALAARAGTIWDAALPRLTRYLASRESPFVLVLDDVDRLESRDSTATVAALVENMPAGSMVVLSGRTVPCLPVATLRVGGPLLELGAYELALSRREAEILLRGCGVERDEDGIAELLRLTEGWAAGLYLAALAARDDAQTGFSGADRDLADYLHSEYLWRLPADLLPFLRRTSVLDRLSAPLCDALLETDDSALALRELERMNVFLVPLDRRRGWFRYHRLFRELLRHELDEVEPGAAAALHRRAAAWYEANGDRESALEHALAGGNHVEAARLLDAIALDVHRSGRVATLERWLERFDEDDLLERYPAVAVHGCRVHGLRGRADDAARWLGAAERGVEHDPERAPLVAAAHAAACAGGPHAMELDAQEALDGIGVESPWRSSALLLRGVAAVLQAEDDRADGLLAEAADEASRLGARETRSIAVAERSLVAAARDDHRRADELGLEAGRLVEDGELADDASSALALAASGRALLRHGQWDRARRQLTAADRLASNLGQALPWLAVQVRLELGHAFVTLRDREAARRLLADARELLAAGPELGVLAALVDELERGIAAIPEPASGASASLTGAELRLLPMLSTHLSFREIGERLYVSRNTIKTQAISVYRKLGVSSRSEAIARAEELGLVDPTEPERTLTAAAS